LDEDNISAKRKDLAQSWFRDMLARAYQGISELDGEAADVVLKRCSEACSAYWLALLENKYDWNRETSDMDAFLKAQEALEKFFAGGKASVRRKGNIIEEEFRPGECTCPLVKKYGLVKPFPGLCLCAQHTFRAVYEAGTGKNVEVQVCESYCRGGKRCLLRFQIEDLERAE